MSRPRKMFYSLEVLDRWWNKKTKAWVKFEDWQEAGRPGNLSNNRNFYYADQAWREFDKAPKYAKLYREARVGKGMVRVMEWTNCDSWKEYDDLYESLYSVRYANTER